MLNVVLFCICQMLQDDLKCCVLAFESVDLGVLSAGIVQAEQCPGWFHILRFTFTIRFLAIIMLCDFRTGHSR